MLTNTNTISLLSNSSKLNRCHLRFLNLQTHSKRHDFGRCDSNSFCDGFKTLFKAVLGAVFKNKIGSFCTSEFGVAVSLISLAVMLSSISNTYNFTVRRAALCYRQAQTAPKCVGSSAREHVIITVTQSI